MNALSLPTRRLAAAWLVSWGSQPPWAARKQKVIISRQVIEQPRVLVLAEPSQGVDVGAKEEIHKLIDMLASEGSAVLVATSDLSEALRIADRLLVIRAGRIMHGKTSRIRHEGKGVFAGLPDAYEATRYHSLVVERSSLPEALEVTAWTENEDGSFEEIMGLRHREYPVEGVQFHPESILTEHGHALLKNFLER